MMIRGYVRMPRDYYFRRTVDGWERTLAVSEVTLDTSIGVPENVMYDALNAALDVINDWVKLENLK